MAGPCDPQKKKPRRQKTKNTMPIGIATSKPISTPTSIAASFSGLALHKSKQRRFRSAKDVSFFPSCSGGPAQVSSLTSSPISALPYSGNTVPICERQSIRHRVRSRRARASFFPFPRQFARHSIVGIYQILITAITAPLIVRQAQFLELVPSPDEQHWQKLQSIGLYDQLFQWRPHSALGGLRIARSKLYRYCQRRRRRLPSAVCPVSTYLGRHRVFIDALEFLAILHVKTL